MSTTSGEPPVYAGFWLRLVASIIDTIVAIIVLSIVGMLLFDSQEPQSIDLQMILSQATSADMLRELLYQMPWQQMTWQNIISALFVIGFWVFFAATPGKMVFGAHIVDAGTLKPASQGQLLIRYLGYFVSTIPFFLGFLWIAFDRRKQGWHDKMANTLVIIGRPRKDEEKSGA